VSRPHQARKRFGQHFLIDPSIINQIVAAIAPRKADTLVEIGPGQGAITIPLSRYPATLHTIEFDRDLVPLLRKRFENDEHVSVHEADALQFDYSTLGSRLRIVGNLPYNISTPLIFRLIEFREHIFDLHFMMQKEVVARMAASPGNKSYGRLTVMLGCFMEVEPLFDVPPTAFSPPPKVTSAVVRMRPKPPGTLLVDDPKALSTLVAQAFSQRRKTLRNALKGKVTEEQLSTVGIDSGCRAEEIPVDTWVRLSNLLSVGTEASISTNKL
jgi:16S rRNA (adenine1518-N6/adenine1519-N6)-dimethyltransferase